MHYRPVFDTEIRGGGGGDGAPRLRNGMAVVNGVFRVNVARVTGVMWGFASERA